ncbi:tRNA (adenine(22)-N(1))-methyltransferase TrmK [Aliikangiella sp. IMCC44359]|uniref:tRNA (adenine(22)-N(1))-methyltransferase TrmK n=1 Tax=Aliikangiella sp. IMCC44359 TaxID=3459125 RepID=UPI00403AD4BB
MKIGQRLKQIDKMITQQYDSIWDCCCDHGLLGLALLKRKAANKIYFVDIIKHLTSNLEDKLYRFFAAEDYINRWQVLCMNTEKILLNTNNNSPHKKHLVIIAGVGGDKIIEMVQSILCNNQKQKVEFLLCPVHHNYKVRKALNSLELGLVDECLVRENNRFYEIMHVATDIKKPISLVGSTMWNLSREDDQEYLIKTIRHYQNKTIQAQPDIEQILSAYQAIKNN